MKSIMYIILFALGTYAYADSRTIDKMINRAARNDALLQKLEDSVVMKGEEEDFKIEARRENNPSYERTGPMRRGPGSGEQDGKPVNPIKAYKNGVMGRNRVWGGYKEADEIAKKSGLEFDAGGFFRAASSRIIDPELAMGETGYFGNKQKFYGESEASERDIKTDNSLQPPNPAVEANPRRGIEPKPPKQYAVPFRQPNPFVQRSNPQRPTLPLIRGPRAQTPQLRGPFK
eukprot:gnl/MRDRNA2_/MRDRNA2_80938_c0_seq1.p1 gnl/MRDRNA2_/MRDRNA2_80938_c0~~gnl/MRDRNA2_/MRDRNA2_80938_c0_seq1.p1  ORF type:complete len:231 (-),score=37.69 gnl/MRDRNA2_/MRDRNA2_80938_c0_seq1:602-1294(-)